VHVVLEHVHPGGALNDARNRFGSSARFSVAFETSVEVLFEKST